MMCERQFPCHSSTMCLGILFKVSGLPGTAKHDIFVLTVDCSLKNGRGRLFKLFIIQ